MKLNIALFTILSAVSALPIIEKRATNNPYLVCGAEDYSCKSEQSSLCYEKANDCWRTETDYSKCSELNNICSEIWSYTGEPQKSDNASTSAKSVPTTTSSVKAIPSSTTAAKAIPSSTTAAKSIPSSTTAAKSIPSSTTAAKSIPSSTTAAKSIPSSTTAAKSIPSSTTAAKAIPSSTTASKAIPTSGASTGEGGVFKPNKDNVKIIGRGSFDDSKGFLWFGLTDSGVEYKFTGKSTTISIDADNGNDPIRYYVYADGELYEDSLIKEKSAEISVEFKEAAEHVVTFIKISECANGTLRITGIKADGKIEPTAAADKKIEFIGDSITCAYGVDGKDTDSFSTTNENGAKSYAYKVAKKFNADYSMFSFSGFGIISGYSTDGKRNTVAALPQYYDKLGFSYWNQFGSDGTQMKEVKWDASAFVPDLIVINLGTNDNSYMNNISADKKKEETAAFVTEYQEFIAKIRSIHPDAEILCTLGVMGQELYPQIEEAVSNYKKETGDEKVNAFKFNVQDLNKNGKAVDWHPAHQSHVDAANELIKEIESLYGWTSDSSVNIDVNSTGIKSNTSENTAATTEADEDTTADEVTIAVEVSTTSTKSPPPASSSTKVPPTTYLTSKVPPTFTTTTSSSKNPPPQTSTKAAPVLTTTTKSSKTPPPQTSTKVAPVVTKTSSKNTPSSSSTKSTPTYFTSKVPQSGKTSTTKSAPPVISTKAAPVLTTTTTAKSAPPVISTKAAPVLTTTTTAKAIPQSTTTAKVIPQSTTTAKAIPQSTTTAKAIPQSTTTAKAIPQSTTTAKAIPQSTTTAKTIPQSTTTAKAIPQSTTTAKAIPKSTTTTKAIPKSTTTTKAIPQSTKTVPKSTTKTTKTITRTTTTSAEPTSPSSVDYYSCEATDWDCKNEMAHLCYEELAECWKQPYTDSLGAECQKINEKCGKIY